MFRKQHMFAQKYLDFERKQLDDRINAILESARNGTVIAVNSHAKYHPSSAQLSGGRTLRQTTEHESSIRNRYRSIFDQISPAQRTVNDHNVDNDNDQCKKSTRHNSNKHSIVSSSTSTNYQSSTTRSRLKRSLPRSNWATATTTHVGSSRMGSNKQGRKQRRDRAKSAVNSAMMTQKNNSKRRSNAMKNYSNMDHRSSVKMKRVSKQSGNRGRTSSSLISKSHSSSVSSKKVRGSLAKRREWESGLSRGMIVKSARLNQNNGGMKHVRCDLNSSGKKKNNMGKITTNMELDSTLMKKKKQSPSSAISKEVPNSEMPKIQGFMKRCSSLQSAKTQRDSNNSSQSSSNSNSSRSRRSCRSMKRLDSHRKMRKEVLIKMPRIEVKTTMTMGEDGKEGRVSSGVISEGSVSVREVEVIPSMMEDDTQVMGKEGEPEQEEEEDEGGMECELKSQSSLVFHFEPLGLSGRRLSNSRHNSGRSSTRSSSSKSSSRSIQGGSRWTTFLTE